MNIYILLPSVLVLLSVLAVIVVLRFRPHSQHDVSPSPDSKVTPIGMYRKRTVRRHRVRTKVTWADYQAGVDRARTRHYVDPGEGQAWSAFFADPDVQAQLARYADESRETEEGGFAVEEDEA